MCPVLQQLKKTSSITIQFNLIIYKKYRQIDDWLSNLPLLWIADEIVCQGKKTSKK